MEPNERDELARWRNALFRLVDAMDDRLDFVCDELDDVDSERVYCEQNCAWQAPQLECILRWADLRERQDTAKHRAEERACRHVCCEPRLMTLEEVRAANGRDLFLEVFEAWWTEPCLTAATLTSVGESRVLFWKYMFVTDAYNTMPYGWRCWTARPTDEQRKTADWIERR